MNLPIELDPTAVIASPEHTPALSTPERHRRHILLMQEHRDAKQDRRERHKARRHARKVIAIHLV